LRGQALSGGVAARSDHGALVIDGPINGASFRAYVEQFLVPTLSRDDVVILDNLGSHKSQAVRRLIRAAGAKLFFLPRYSPDLNPIEQVFAKLKTLLRKADPRITEDTWHRIGSLLDHFTAPQCRKLPRQCRLRFNLKQSRSNVPPSRLSRSQATARLITFKRAVSNQSRLIASWPSPALGSRERALLRIGARVAPAPGVSLPGAGGAALAGACQLDRERHVGDRYLHREWQEPGVVRHPDVDRARRIVRIAIVAGLALEASDWRQG
jgi:transposase